MLNICKSMILSAPTTNLNPLPKELKGIQFIFHNKCSNLACTVFHSIGGSNSKRIPKTVLFFSVSGSIARTTREH
jgi:hypothetical protein